MDIRTTVNGPTAEAEDWTDPQDAAEDQLSSTARHALEGCIFGLTPDLSDETIRPGEAYIDGNRLRLREAEDIDIAGLTRPTGTMVAWVAIFASYTTASSGTVTDDQGVQHVRHQRDSIVVTVTRGVNAASESAAVKPAVPSGSIVLCDVLLDATSDVEDLDSSPDRRPQCPDDNLQAQIDRQSATINDIAAALHAASATPNKGPTPAATSTVSLRIDATWSAGSVPSGAPALSGYRFRWRQAGENWSTGRTVTLTDVLAYMFSVPDADSDVEMQVAASNSNGTGGWSNIGTIDAADIFDPPPLQTRTFTADTDYTWPFPQSSQARVTVTGGGGGDGGGGGGGGGSNNSHDNGGGGGGGGADGGGGGGGRGDTGVGGGDGGDADGNAGQAGGSGSSTGGDGGSAGGNGEDGEDGGGSFTPPPGANDGGNGANRGGGGGSGGGRTGDSSGGNGGDNGGTGGTATGGGSGGGGGGDGGGDGGDGGVGIAGDGGGGGGGEAGGGGGDSRVAVTTRAVDISAGGGDGGSGGGGGGGAEESAGSDGSDGVSSGTGSGGSGGSGGNGTGAQDGGDGGAGAPGVGGSQLISDVSGLQVGDVFAITIGDGGEAGTGGGAGGAGGTSVANGSMGSAGSAGDAGSVVIEPLT